jgi:addiction module HigA family antidote
MVRIPSDRPPSHPGEILFEEFLVPLDLTQLELAEAIRVPLQQVEDIVNGRQDVSPGTSLRLARYFKTSPDFWLNLQMRWDLYHARLKGVRDLDQIQPYTAVD